MMDALDNVNVDQMLLEERVIDVSINFGILILKLDALNVNVMLMEVKIKDVTIIQDNAFVKLELKD